MSNNIYDILKKMAGLEAPKQSLTESKKSKPDYLDMDKDGNKKEPMKRAAKDKAKSGMAEAVARVEQQLAEKYRGYKKIGEGVEAKGMISPKDGGEEYQPAPGYRVRAEFEPGTGKQKMGFVKAEPEKSQAALPTAPTADQKNKPVDESGLQAYLGKKKYGEQGMRALQKAGREGAGKEKMAMIRAKHDKMDEGSYNEEMFSPKQKSFAALAEPKDKITYADRIAGAKKGKKTEGNKFSGNLANARAQGLKQADLDGDGDMEKVTPGMTTMSEETGEERAASASRENERYDSARNYQGRNTRGDVIRSGGEVVRANPNPPSLLQRAAGKLGLSNTAKDALGDPMYKSSRPTGGGGGGIGGHLADPSAVKSLIPNFESKKSMREGWEEMQKYLDKKKGPESKGGEGKKAGTRYGGSAQQDDSEDTDGEGKPVEKKKGRPKGTGGGAKFNFKKPKD